MNWSKEEKRIIELFKPGTSFVYKNKNLHSLVCTKPIYSSGEGKTDIYILCDNGTEIKISTKTSSADFLENKISKNRYIQIFGNDFTPVIKAIDTLKPLFLNKQVYYPETVNRVQAGSYTMGWRIDIINTNSGKLTAPLDLTIEQKKNIFYGNTLTGNKRNPSINNTIIKDAGIANNILLNSEKYNTAQEIIDALIDAENYDGKIYITFRAVNYRSKQDAIDGNRPLGVAVKWFAQDKYELIFDKPLEYGAKNDMLKFFKEHIK